MIPRDLVVLKGSIKGSSGGFKGVLYRFRYRCRCRFGCFYGLGVILKGARIPLKECGLSFGLIKGRFGAQLEASWDLVTDSFFQACFCFGYIYIYVYVFVFFSFSLFLLVLLGCHGSSHRKTRSPEPYPETQNVNPKSGNA